MRHASHPEVAARERFQATCETIRNLGIEFGASTARAAIVEALMAAGMLDAAEFVMKTGDRKK